MSYVADVQGTSDTPDTDFVAVLDTILLAAGFTFVEDYVSATTDVSKIYLSPAASNIQGEDWYLNVRSGNTAKATYAVCIGVAELWDTGTKYFNNYAPYVGYNYYPVPTVTFTYDDATGVHPDAIQAPIVGTATAGFEYWVSCTVDRVIVGTRIGTTETTLYAGLYDDFLPVGISPFPLLQTGFSTYPENSAGTREPGITTGIGNNFGISIGVWTVSVPSDMYRTTPLPTRSAVCNGQTQAVRGLLKDTIFASSLTAANGDTMTVATLGVSGTKTYVRFGYSAWVDSSV